MKPLPKQDPSKVGGGTCVDPPLHPTWPSPFPPRDPIPLPSEPYPGPGGIDNPIV
jgi:hypothetical protein